MAATNACVFSKLSRQEVDGILSVVSTLLPPTESLAAAAKGGLLIPAVSIPHTGLSSHDDARAQYSLYKYIASTLQLVFSCRGSLESKFSVLDFVSYCLEIFSKAARQNPKRKAWV